MEALCERACKRGVLDVLCGEVRYKLNFLCGKLVREGSGKEALSLELSESKLEYVCGKTELLARFCNELVNARKLILGKSLCNPSGNELVLVFCKLLLEALCERACKRGVLDVL